MSKATASDRPRANPTSHEAASTPQSMPAAHADKLLQAAADAGQMRSGGAAASKFKAAAKKVLVTNEVMHMLASCQSELRQAQQDFGKSQVSEGSQQSVKARQNEALAAADAAATYSLRSAARGRVDAPAVVGSPAAPAAAAGGGQVVAAQDTPVVPKDWGFLKNVDRLTAAPAAAAARQVAGELTRQPEQPYLSTDAATKAAHEAWQAPQDAGWRKVLTAKKHRQANRAELDEAEREQAARFIQANWLAHRMRLQQQRVREQQLKAWADEHYAAAIAGRLAAAAAAAGQASSTQPAGQTGSGGSSRGSTSDDDGTEELSWRRRSRVAAEDFKKPHKPVVQPWSRMVGREAPLNTTATAATAGARAAGGASKWRGAVSGTIAAGKLAAMAGAAAAGDAGGGTEAEQHSEAVSTPPPDDLSSAAPAEQLQPLARMSSAVPVPVGGRVARTSSALASVLGNIAGIFRMRSNSGGGGGSNSSSGAVGAGGSTGSGSSSTSSSADGSALTAPKPAGSRLSSRLSLDFAAFFGSSQKPSSSSSSELPPPAPPAPAPPAFTHTPSPPLNRRRSVEFVRNLFRRNSVDIPTDAASMLQAGGSSLVTAAAAAPAAAAAGTAQPESRFVTAESFELPALAASQLPSPLLSGCVTARESLSDTEGVSHHHTGGATTPRELAARGAAAADAYLAAASEALASREAVMSLCGGVSAAGGAQAAAGSYSPSGGISAAGGAEGGGGAAAAEGQAAAGSGSSLRSTTTGTSFVLRCAGSGSAAGAPAQGSEDTSSGFESIWTQIAAAAVSDGDSSGAEAQQQQAVPAAASVAAAAGGRSSKQLGGPRPSVKARVVGQADVGFEPNRPGLLVTAADIASSSLLYKPAAAPKALAAGSGASGVAGRLPPAVCLTADLPAVSQRHSQGGPPSPALSDTSTLASPSSSQASPSSRSSSSWPHWAHPRPPPSKEHAATGSSSSSSRPTAGPRPGHMMCRQLAKKSVDLSHDAAAALAAGPPSPTGSQGQAVLTGSARPSSAGMSSVSQKLAVARRMAATAAAEDDEEGAASGGSSSSSAVATVNLQLDGSAKRHSTSSRGSSKVAMERPAGAGQLRAAGGSSSSSSNANGGITSQQASLLQGISRKGSAEAGLALRPTTTAAAGGATGRSVAWAQPEPPAAAPAGSLSTHRDMAASFLSGLSAGRINPSSAGSQLGAAAKAKCLPDLAAGHNHKPLAAVHVAVAGSANGRPQQSAAVSSKPRRNSYSNDGSKPQPQQRGGVTAAGLSARVGAAAGSAGELAVGGGRLRPTGASASCPKPAPPGSQSDAQRRLSLLL